MARFRGLIQGNRGSVTRLGSASSGMYAEAAGWDGGISISLYSNEGNDDNTAIVRFKTHVNGAGDRAMVYSGPLGWCNPAGFRANPDVDELVRVVEDTIAWFEEAPIDELDAVEQAIGNCPLGSLKEIAHKFGVRSA